MEVAHIEVDRGCPNRVVLDENAVDNGLESLRFVLIDTPRHRFVETGIVEISTWRLCSLAEEFADVVD